MIDTKLLRQKILDLAIRGKLVPQNPEDEPASVLLEKIRQEKAALVKAGKIKKDKHESFIFRGDDKHYYEQIDGKTVDITEEIPFDLPNSWSWCRLRNLGEIVGGGTPSTDNTAYWDNGDVAWLSPADLTSYTNKYISRGKKSITQSGLLNSSAKLMPKGSVLYSSRAPIGYVVISAGEISTNQGFKSIVPVTTESNEFLYYYLKAVTSEIKSRATGTTFKEISGNEFGATLVPLPPLPEQQRIVFQIEALFSEVDKIEKDSADLESALALAKQKVLDLAIRGKLVPQDPNDEPASELLKRIKTEKDALIKARKIKRDKHESYIFKGDDNRYYEKIDEKLTEITEIIPFDIPKSWNWVRLNDISYPVGSKEDQILASEIKQSGIIPVVSQGGALIDGFCNNNDKIIKDIPLVLFGDHTRNVKFLDFEFVVGADGTKLQKPICIVPKFLYLLLQYAANKLQNRGYARHYTLLKKELLILPPLEEQKSIVNTLSKYDCIIQQFQ